MENFYRELLKWDEASKEIEEEAREMLRSRHRLGFTCIKVFGAILMGIVMFKLAQIEEHSSVFIKVFFNLCAIVYIAGGITIGCSYYNDEKYLKGKDTQEKVRVKTVLLHEVITDRGYGPHGHVHRYLKISYPMGEETIVRKLSYSELHYDIDLLGLDLVGLYGKKITIVYCNEEFYILNHVYPEYDDEERKLEGKTGLLKNSETTVRSLVESRDKEQIKRKKLQEELSHQMNYQYSKYCLIIFIVIGGVVWSILGVHGAWSVVVGGAIGIFLVLSFATWVSCKKHSGGIWDKAKLRNVYREIEKKL